MTARYDALMEVVRSRMTNRAFAPADIPRAHIEMILEAARHAPSGANAQPWHFIVVTDAAAKASASWTSSSTARSCAWVFPLRTTTGR